ncbi:MAG: sigma-54 dependent transcriptional regulator [Candidatus Margulisbacteria bacterium]|nr:sigma-54 dependent transcriptional regulator [Candidatus Margulisiibacteriota bacterium]
MSINILIVDDEKDILNMLSKPLVKEGYRVETAENGKDALAIIKKGNMDVVFLDYNMPGDNGLVVLDKIKAHHPDIFVIMITAHAEIDLAVNAIKAGAYDFLSKPFKLSGVKAVLEKIKKALSQKEEINYLKDKVKEFTCGEMIGESMPMKEVYKLIEKVADSSTTILIRGKSGTGKELVAKTLHQKSSRATKPLQTINCSAIPSQLLESELFGYEKGSFTDARESKKGLIEATDGGTLFLDEIGDMSLELQAKLLRAIESRKIRHIGGHDEIFIECRFVAATHRDLEAMVKEGKFREDLFHRLNVIQINLAPLIERNGDLEKLSAFFITKFNKEMGKNIEGLSPETKNILENYSFPGNIRELKNIIERAVLLSEGKLITPDLLPDALTKGKNNSTMKTANVDISAYKKQAGEEAEKQYILSLLKSCQGNVTLSAKKAGIRRTSLLRIMKKYGLKSKNFKI